MKKLLYICLLFLLCSYNCLYGAYHNSFDSNGFRWELKADKVEGSQPNWPTNPSVVFKYISGTVSQTIIFFNMTLTDYYYINPTDSLVTDIVIPSDVIWDSNGSLGLGSGPLQIIASNAFYNKPVTSVDIPSSILTIKLPCFNNCGNLKSIKINGKDNFTPSFAYPSNYSTLNGVLFNSDKTQLKKYPEGKNDELFKVPQSVSKLDNGCFANTKNLAIQFFGAAPEIHENAFVNSTAVVYYPKGAEGWPDFDGGYFDEWGVMAYPIGEQDYVTEDGVILRFHKENSSVIIDNVMYGLGSCTIPSTIGGYPVTSIGDYAFESCSGLTSVTIPNSVTSIGERAFLGCSSCTKFIVDSNNPNYKSVNGLLLSKDGKTLIAGINGNVVIPDSVTSIGDHAFSGCSGLTSVTIPDSVTSIGDSAFYGCSSLTSVTIPDSVTSIGEYAFSWCSCLTSVTIPDSVTSIGSWAFSDCNSLLFDTTTKQGVKLVDGWVVGYTDSCPSVLDLTGIRGIGDSAFDGYSGLTSITIPESVTSIGNYAFCDCSGLTSVIIPDSVTSIGHGAFAWCDNIKTVTVGQYICSNGLDIFWSHQSITNVVILDGVTSIGDDAFNYCDGLTSITIPDSVTSIGSYAFNYCDGLTSITIPDSVTSIGSYAFSGCNEALYDYETIPGVILVDGWVVDYTDSCPSVLDLTGVRGIAGSAFSGCSGLTSVTIPQGVTSIDDWAFAWWSGLTSITIPDSVTSIGDGAFYGCNGLTSITIPNSVTSIGDSAFSDCSGLTEFIVDSNNPSYKSVNGLLLSKDGKTLIAGINGNVVIPDSVTSIGDSAFDGYSGLTSITIPESVTSIDDWAFAWCSGLTSITIPNSVTSIGDSAFSDCSGLTSVTIPDSVTSIGDDMFAYCRNLTSVTIGSGVASIGRGAFRDCYLLKSAIFLGDAPRDVGDYPFNDCADDFVIKVKKGTKGWNGDYTSTALPTTWHGCPIEYATESELNVTYKVAFNANGGSGTMAAQTIACNTWTKLRANAFKRTGYTFQGWAKSKTGAVAYKNGASVKNLASSGTVTLYAVWKPNTYNVAFNANGGSGSMSAQTMGYDTLTKLRANAFKRTGYTFQGWAKSKTGAVAYKNGVSVKNLASSGTVTLYAIWKPNTYNVAFNANGGSGTMSDQSMTYNNAAYLKNNAFKRTGYTFQGWAKSKTGTVAYKDGVSVKNLASSGTVILYAIWKPITYKVAFYANGGTGSMSAQSMTYNNAAYLKNNAFKRTGYTFLGWAKSPTGAVAYKNATAVKNLSASGVTIKLYAKWAKTKYKIAFYANGGKGTMSAQTMIYNKAAYLKKNAFKRTGYTFLGWAKSATGSVVYTNGKAVKNLSTSGATIKLYAKWAKTKYKIAFYANGGTGSMSAQSMTYNKAAYLSKNAFKRSGYIFLGWAKSKNGAVAYKNAQAVKNLRSTKGTIKLYAVWAKPKYKVAFYANGGSGPMSAQSMTYNKAAYLKKNAFKRTGYTFAGWAKSSTGSVVYSNGKAVKNLTRTGGTVKLYAKWTPITYKVTFYPNGGTGSAVTQTMTYNKAANLRSNTFTRTGYTFAGWSKSTTGSVAYTNGQSVKNLSSINGATVKLYAVWKPNTYKVTFYPNGGTGSAVTQTMTYNKAANLRSNTFTRTGYTFAGWSKSTTGSVAYTNGQSVKNLSSTNGATVKLYAVWKPNTYKVTFYPNGGTGSAVTQTMTYNKAANLRSNTFTRPGYTFLGWAKSTSGSVVYSNGQSVKNLSSTNGATVKLYAVWKKSSTLDFTTSGDSNWFYDDDGTLTSGTISHSQRTILETTVFGAGTISFNWAVSSEANYDWLSFYVDGEQIKQISGTDQSWQYVEYEITGSGTHIINWIYSKDSSYSNGDDCGWVKDVMWKPYSSKNGVQLWEGGPYWAETNIGAEKPEDYGYYFWWGDTIGYNRVNDKLVASDGSSSNFSFYDYNTPTYDKFNSELQSEGWITSNGVLAPEHDAARAHWGSNWRMPTYSELQALCDNCTWTWTKKNGVNGYVVSGKGAYSGASIFLPAAGYDRGSSLYSAGSTGYYWSSVPNSDSGYCSWYLYFGSSYPSMDYYYRGSGHPVRPVLDVQ